MTQRYGVLDILLAAVAGWVLASADSGWTVLLGVFLLLGALLPRDLVKQP